MGRIASEDSSQRRLLLAGKALFAERGYEQTSTAAIARRAGTSESQLVRYFGGKRGLLTAVFDDSWRLLNQRIDQRIAATSGPIAGIESVMASVMEAFQRDPELAYLLLFEGRRIRESGRHLELSTGYQLFARRFQQLIRNAQQSGAVLRSAPTAAVASALMGAAEGMMRDGMVAEISGKPKPFSRTQVKRVFAAMLQGITESRAARRPGK